MARWLSSYIAVFMAGILSSGQCATPHTSHWKAGAGIWHPIEEPLPLVAYRGNRLAAEEAETLTVVPSVLDINDYVTVSWQKSELELNHDVTAPHGDIIGVYCPETADDSDYVDYLEVDITKHSVKFGPLVNMRCRYQFRYLHRTTRGSYEVRAQSAPVGFRRGAGQPTQGRLSETGNRGEMNVMWVSGLDNASTVEYSTGNPNTTKQLTAVGKPHTYAASDLCNKPANETAALKFRNPGFIHHVVLKGLDDGTLYYYRYGSEDQWSDWKTFRTQPAPGSSDEVNFFVYGDLGEWRNAAGPPPGDRGYSTIGHIETELFNSSREYNLLMHVGDISYARGQAFQWDQFGEMTEKVATRIPYYVGIGNHEYDHVAGGHNDPSGAAGTGYHPSWGNYGSDSGGECAVPVVNRFAMPSTSANSRPPFWYSHDYGMIHLIWLSTEHDYYPGSQMHNFLVADLEGVNRTRTPWVFVLGHRPMYTSRSSTANYLIQTHQREAYEEVLQKYGVDVFWSGHYHSYERTCAVYQEKCREENHQPQATVHIMVGMAGAGHDQPDWMPELWAVSHFVDYGYNRVRVANATHLFTEYVENETGKVKDSTWIVSDHKWHEKAAKQWAV